MSMRAAILATMGIDTTRIDADMAVAGRKVKSGVEKVERSSALQSAASGDIRGALGAVGELVGVSAGAVAGISAVAAGLAFGANAANELTDAADSASVSVGFLGALQDRFAAAGLGAQAATDSVIKLRKALADAGEDAGSNAGKAFSKLGVTVKESNGELRDTQVVYNEAVEALSRIENKAQAAGVAFEIFGRAGGKALAALQQGAVAEKSLTFTNAVAGANSVWDLVEKIGVGLKNAAMVGAGLTVGSVGSVNSANRQAEAVYAQALKNREAERTENYIFDTQGIEGVRRYKLEQLLKHNEEVISAYKAGKKALADATGLGDEAIKKLVGDTSGSGLDSAMSRLEEMRKKIRESVAPTTGTELSSDFVTRQYEALDKLTVAYDRLAATKATRAREELAQQQKLTAEVERRVLTESRQLGDTATQSADAWAETRRSVVEAEYSLTQKIAAERARIAALEQEQAAALGAKDEAELARISGKLQAERSALAQDLQAKVAGVQEAAASGTADSMDVARAKRELETYINRTEIAVRDFAQAAGVSDLSSTGRLERNRQFEAEQLRLANTSNKLLNDIAEATAGLKA